MKKYLKAFLIVALLAVCGAARAQNATASLTAQDSVCPAVPVGKSVNTDAGALEMALTSPSGAATLTVSGTWSGTISFYASGDNGTTWVPLYAAAGNSTAVASSTANGTWQANVAGYSDVCVMFSTYSSGTAVATIQLSPASARANGGGTSSPGIFLLASYGAAADEKRAFDGAMLAVPGAEGASTSPATPTWTTSLNNDVVLALFQLVSSNFSSAPSTGTNIVNVAQSSGLYGAYVNYQTVLTAGSVSPVTGTFAASHDWVAGTIPFVSNGSSITLSTPTTAQQASGATITVNKPTGTASGNFVLLCVLWYDATSPANSIIGPTSFARVFQKTDATSDTTTCYGKIAGGSEPSTYSATQVISADGMTAFAITLTNVAAVDDPLTSTSASFVSGDVGKDLCVAASPQGCGTIAMVLSSTEILPSGFGNGSGTNLTSGEYRYGTDNSTALQNALNAVGVNGGTLQFANAGYMFNRPLTLPNTASFIFQGVASSTANWGYATGGTTVDSKVSGSELDFASVASSSPALSLAFTNSVSANVFQDTIQNVTIWGGAGVGRDGGGTGLLLQNFSRLVLRNSVIGNFLADGVDAVASGASGYIDGLTYDNSWTMLNGGDGTHIYFSNGGGSIQNIYLQNSQFDNNGSYGLEIGAGAIWTIKVVANNFQRNGGSYEVNLAANTVLTGCDFSANYWETDVGGRFMMPLVTGFTGCTWGPQSIEGGDYNSVFSPIFSAAGVPIAPAANYTHMNPVSVSDTTSCTAGTQYDGNDTGHSVSCYVQSNGTHWYETGMRAF